MSIFSLSDCVTSLSSDNESDAENYDDQSDLEDDSDETFVLNSNILYVDEQSEEQNQEEDDGLEAAIKPNRGQRHRTR